MRDHQGHSVPSDKQEDSLVLSILLQQGLITGKEHFDVQRSVVRVSISCDGKIPTNEA